MKYFAILFCIYMWIEVLISYINYRKIKKKMGQQIQAISNFPTAVVTPSIRTFNEFCKLTHGNGVTYYKIETEFDCRGLTWAGYVLMYDANKIDKLANIVYLLEQRSYIEYLKQFIK